MSEMDRITDIIPRYDDPPEDTGSKTPRHRIVLWVINLIVWPWACGLASYTFLHHSPPPMNPAPIASAGMGVVPQPSFSDVPTFVPSQIPPSPVRPLPTRHASSPRPKPSPTRPSPVEPTNTFSGGG